MITKTRRERLISPFIVSRRKSKLIGITSQSYCRGIAVSSLSDPTSVFLKSLVSKIAGRRENVESRVAACTRKRIEIWSIIRNYMRTGVRGCLRERRIPRNEIRLATSAGAPGVRSREFRDFCARARGQRHLLKTKMVASNMPYPCPALMARQMSAFSRLPSTMYSPPTPTDVSDFAVNRGNRTRTPVVGSVARAK